MEQNKRHLVVEEWEIQYALTRGINPLFNQKFYVALPLRRKITQELFPKNDEENNIKFYHWIWDNSPHYCAECMKPLEHYSSCFISHRWSRGAHQEMKFDPYNVDILCKECHAKFENPITRKGMRIFPRIEKEMNQLREEYNGIK